MKALRANEKRLGFDVYTQSGLRHYLPETALGTWEVGGPTTHVRDVAGVEPEDFLTIARRYVNGPDTRRTAGNFIREFWNFILVGLTPGHRLDKFDRLQQHPQPAHTRHSGESVVWRNEHTASADATPDRLSVFEIHPASVSQLACAAGAPRANASAGRPLVLAYRGSFPPWSNHSHAAAGARSGQQKFLQQRSIIWDAINSATVESTRRAAAASSRRADAAPQEGVCERRTTAATSA
jgi:hypothetical protein